MTFELFDLLNELNNNELSVIYYISKNKNDSESLRAKANETPYRVGYDSTAFIFKLTHLKTKDDFIEISKNFEYLVSMFGLEYKNNNDYIRFSIKEFTKLSTEELQEFVYNITIRSFSFSSFGCCSRYPNCEKTGCTHPDKLYATTSCTVFHRLFFKNI